MTTQFWIPKSKFVHFQKTPFRSSECQAVVTLQIGIFADSDKSSKNGYFQDVFRAPRNAIENPPDKCQELPIFFE